MVKLTHHLKQHVQQRLNCARVLKRLMDASRHCKTQLALAKKSGIAQSTIGRILRGEIATQTSTILFLVDALGITQEEFWSAVEGDNPAKVGPRESTVTDVALDVNACRIARRRAERVLQELWQEQDQALEALKQHRQEEDRAIKRLDSLVFGLDPEEMDQGSTEVEVSA